MFAKIHIPSVLILKFVRKKVLDSKKIADVEFFSGGNLMRLIVWEKVIEKLKPMFSGIAETVWFDCLINSAFAGKFERLVW